MKGYRNEEFFNSGASNIVDVITFEISELENTDIIDYVKEHYPYGDITKVADLILEAHENDACKRDIKAQVKVLVELLRKHFGKPLTRVLWLCRSKDDVIKSDYVQDEFEIDEVNTTDIILSDLQEEGVLYAYTEDEWRNRYD